MMTSNGRHHAPSSASSSTSSSASASSSASSATALVTTSSSSTTSPAPSPSPSLSLSLKPAITVTNHLSPSSSSSGNNKAAGAAMTSVTITGGTGTGAAASTSSSLSSSSSCATSAKELKVPDHNLLKPTSPTYSGSSSPSKGGKEKDKVNADCKLAVLGNVGVGKSALVVRLLTNRFIWEYDVNLEAIYRHSLEIDDDNYVVEVMDTGPQADISVTENHVRWGDGFVLVFSLTNRESFEAVRPLHELIHSTKPPPPPVPSVVLIANKTEMIHDHEVTTAEAEALAEELNVPLFKLSASEGGEDIVEAFREVSRDVIRKRWGRRRRSSAKMVVEAMFNRVRTKINS